MIKKIIMTLAAISVLAGAVLGGFVWHIYKMDFGVPYKGRARLDYNWKYYSAELPKEEYTFEGRWYSYKYPKFSRSQKIIPVGSSAFELAEDNRKLLCVIWDGRNQAYIKSELLKYLSAREPVKPSQKFLQWLYFDGNIQQENERYAEYDKLFDIKTEKIAFSHGGEGLLISLWSKVQERPHMKFMAAVTPGGQVFKTRSLVRHNASEKIYEELVFSGAWIERVLPDAERDAQSAYSLKKFITTVEFNK